jgi:hypothetical protein
VSYRWPQKLNGVDLAHKDLQGINLAGASLQGVNAKGTDFTGSQLSMVDFSSSDLTGARLTEAKLMMAKLDNATCDEASFEDANIAGASFNGASLDRARMGGCIGTAEGYIGAPYGLGEEPHWLVGNPVNIISLVAAYSEATGANVESARDIIDAVTKSGRARIYLNPNRVASISKEWEKYGVSVKGDELPAQTAGYVTILLNGEGLDILHAVYSVHAISARGNAAMTLHEAYSAVSALGKGEQLKIHVNDLYAGSLSEVIQMMQEYAQIRLQEEHGLE